MVINKFKAFSIFYFFSSLIFTFSIGEIFYNSIDGTDFYRYFRYIEYFNGSIETTSREQGLFYFWFISLFIDFYDQFYIADKWEFIYSSAIQMGNFILYLIGLLGLFVFLKTKKINTTKIFISLSFLNFFPPVFGARLIMKPEMLAFAIFPWILIGLDKYFLNKNIFYLLSVVPLLAIIATSKGTVIILVASSLLFIYFNKIRKLKFFDIGIALTIFILMSYFLYQENLNVNSVSMLFHPELESYQYKASFSFIYTLSISDLFLKPFRNVHAGSLFGITSIDLFGDYFNRYWDHERSLFISNRSEVVSFLDYPRRNLSVIFSIIFFISTFIKEKSFKYSLYTKVYLVGIAILLLTSLGVFGLHFNPNKGDTVKTHYYFFLLAFSFVFIVIKFLNKTKQKTHVIFLIFIFLAFSFIVGFPKNYETDFNESLSEKLPTTLSCRFVSPYFENIRDLDITCLTKQIATCGSFNQYNKPIEHEDGYLIFQADDFFQNINLQDADGNTVTVTGYAECLHYLEGGYFNSQSVDYVDRTPRANRLFLYLAMFSIFYIIYHSRNSFKK